MSRDLLMLKNREAMYAGVVADEARGCEAVRMTAVAYKAGKNVCRFVPCYWTDRLRVKREEENTEQLREKQKWSG